MMASGGSPPRRRPSLSERLFASTAHDPPSHDLTLLPPSSAHPRARTFSQHIFPSQEGISTSATPTPPNEPAHELVQPVRGASVLQRVLTSLSGHRGSQDEEDNEQAIADSPEDEFPPQAAIEPSQEASGSEGTAYDHPFPPAASSPSHDPAAPGSPTSRRRMSLSSRVFRRSPSLAREKSRSPEPAALGRPRPRRKSLSEKLAAAEQENVGIPIPSPPSPTPAPSPPEEVEGRRHERPESPSPSEAIEPPSSRVRSYHPLALEMLILLMPGSVFGVLARLGLTALDTYDGQGVFALAWVQGVGCLVMGACVGWRDQITAFHPPLYTAIATGFCGSLTTFSSWMLDVFLAFSNGYGYERIWIYDIMDGLTRTFVTFAVSLCGLSLGLHIASYDLSHNHLIRRLGKLHISLPLRLFLITASLVIYLLTIPMYFVLSPRFRPLATSALLYSFPGTVMRHILGTQLNGRHPYYPIGTFLANALGTAFLSIFHALQRLPPSATGLSLISGTSCVVLQGLIDGLCGCLTTVSTFAVEVRGMQGRGRQARRAWAYAIGSWAAGQILMVAILGGTTWRGGARESYWCVSGL